jgi:hypothetical protein
MAGVRTFVDRRNPKLTLHEKIRSRGHLTAEASREKGEAEEEGEEEEEGSNDYTYESSVSDPAPYAWGPRGYSTGVNIQSVHCGVENEGSTRSRATHAAGDEVDHVSKRMRLQQHGTDSLAFLVTLKGPKMAHPSAEMQAHETRIIIVDCTSDFDVPSTTEAMHGWLQQDDKVNVHIVIFHLGPSETVLSQRYMAWMQGMDARVGHYMMSGGDSRVCTHFPGYAMQNIALHHAEVRSGRLSVYVWK